MQLEPITRLSRDLKEASVTLSRAEARFLVDAYYQMQENRKRAANQSRSLSENAEPHAVIDWLLGESRGLENQIRRALDAYSAASELGAWARSVKGIGPVIAAGLLAHIDLEPWRCAVAKADAKKKPCKASAPHGPECHHEVCETVGHIWRFAGLDPTSKWEKKTRRPWNAALKTLCWKIGESFVKVSGDEAALYAQIYVKRKAQEVAKNEAGEFADQAARILTEKKLGKDTEAFKAYTAGQLPPAHIHARAKRYAVKLFLSHYHETAYRLHFGTEPPLPYPIAILGHAHRIEPSSL